MLPDNNNSAFRRVAYDIGSRPCCPSRRLPERLAGCPNPDGGALSGSALRTREPPYATSSPRIRSAVPSTILLSSVQIFLRKHSGSVTAAVASPPLRRHLQECLGTLL